MAYLDSVGLAHFWAQCLNKFAAKDDVPVPPYEEIEQIQEDLTNLETLVGTTAVATQISNAIDGLATEVYVDNKVAAMVNSAPETLDTLNELATALGNDPNFATTVANQIGSKADADHIQALEKGGTGATTRSAGFLNLAFIGNNPITSTEDDTPTKWTELGSGYARFSQNYVIDQPYVYGILINYAYYQDITQIWLSLSAHHKLYTRSGNASGWFSSWIAVYDTVNKPTAADVGAVSKTGDTMTGTLVAPSVYIKNSYPCLTLSDTNNTACVLIQADTNNNRLGFHQKRGGSNVWESNEAYFLPDPDLNQTAIATYSILTSKHPVTIAQGGTGATTRAGAFNNLFRIGTRPITSTANDTMTKWRELGNGLAWYGTSGQLIDQPTTYGTLLNLNAANSEVAQLWFSAPSGAVYHRGANDGGWSGTWIKFYDTSNKPTPAEIGAATSSHTHNSITDGTASASIGIATTPILSMRKSGYNHWSIERVGDSDNRLKWHYYDPTTGAWQGNALLIDTNGGTINGAVTINNTLTATKVIGAVYA